jgi:hypothetical protein
MISRIAADLVLIAHFSFVFYAVFGGFLLVHSNVWIWTHLPVVVWSSVVNLAGWTCPLTPLENRLRRLAGQAGYQGGFVEHYVGALVYPRGMPRRLEIVAGISIIGWNAIVYLLVFLLLPTGNW